MFGKLNEYKFAMKGMNNVAHSLPVCWSIFLVAVLESLARAGRALVGASSGSMLLLYVSSDPEAFIIFPADIISQIRPLALADDPAMLLQDLVSLSR